MNKNELSSFIKSEAIKLGFDKVGIAEAKSTSREQEHLGKWISSGFHGTMKWMEKRQEERGNIHSYFPEAQSVISVAVNYFTGISKERVAEGSKELYFSNYAWGDDYHVLVKSRLRKLSDRLKEIVPGCRGIYCVDTSPVMEKVWAQRAGIGWLGKHTNIITRDLGSWVFLGELIVDIELEPDQPFQQDLCGTCTACLEACPTSALDEYILDSNKCISYKTIEYRGEFNNEDNIHGWVYGCDICQEVCPWNIKFSSHSTFIEFEPRHEIASWSREEWKKALPASFNKIFKNSAVKRAKVAGLIRNFTAID